VGLITTRHPEGADVAPGPPDVPMAPMAPMALLRAHSTARLHELRRGLPHDLASALDEAAKPNQTP
jgi:hypothetical protein